MGDYFGGTELGIAEGLSRVEAALLRDFSWCLENEGGGDCTSANRATRKTRSKGDERKYTALY